MLGSINASGLNASTFPQPSTAGAWSATPQATVVNPNVGSIIFTLANPIYLQPGQFVRIFIYAYGNRRLLRYQSDPTNPSYDPRMRGALPIPPLARPRWTRGPPAALRPFKSPRTKPLPEARGPCRCAGSRARGW